VLSGYGLAVRQTEFWERMNRHLGSTYAQSVAHDLVLSKLGSRTALQALETDTEPRDIWLAVCEELEIPVRDRH
jgi:hypothetical protein